MIDHQLVVETGTGQAHAPARQRRQARNAQEPESCRGVLAIAAGRVDMQVEPPPVAGRGELRDHLLGPDPDAGQFAGGPIPDRSRSAGLP